MSTAVTWVVHTDLVNMCRGRGLTGYNPTIEPRPEIGWVPADLALDAFGGLVDNPWGSVGELRLVPDPATFIEVDATAGRLPPFRVVLAGCADLEGREWPSCPRGVLRRTVEQLRDEFGLQFLAAVEHEFALLRPGTPVPFSLDAARRAEPLLTTVIEAMDDAGLGPENILPEFGNNQIEVTHEPGVGVSAADRTVLAREIVREVARALDEDLTFAPVIGDGAGTNGAHIHFSLLDQSGRPRTEDADSPCGLTETAAHFAAGVMAHLPALTALAAPSAASYLRLRPGGWSAAYTAWGIGNREAALRLAPGRPFAGGKTRLGPSLEFRPSDATANPYLAIAGLIIAGMDGLRRQLPLSEPIDIDPHAMSPGEREERGVVRLPQSLDDALDGLEADDMLMSLFSPELRHCWFSLKRAEARRFSSASPSEIIEDYVRVY